MTATEGERKIVTALFADIQGSMDLMAELDPEEAEAVVAPALALMSDAVARYDGHVVQSTGDGVFALFGAPVAYEDHARRALHAALRMQDDIRRYAERLRLEKGTSLAIRVGLNTGEVVVRSTLHDDGHADVASVGHAIGLAQRMESLADPGCVVVSERTYALTTGFFDFQPLGAARVKGVPEPVRLYQLLGIGPLRTRLERRATGGLSRFVGREPELATLERGARRSDRRRRRSRRGRGRGRRGQVAPLPRAQESGGRSRAGARRRVCAAREGLLVPSGHRAPAPLLRHPARRRRAAPAREGDGQGAGPRPSTRGHAARIFSRCSG